MSTFKPAMVMTFLSVLVLATVGHAIQVKNGGADVAALPIGSRLQLAVEPQWIEHMDGVELRAQVPQPREVAIQRSGGNGYMTVLKDGDLYRMYYRYIVPGRDTVACSKQINAAVVKNHFQC